MKMCYPEASSNICVGLYEGCDMGKNLQKFHRRSEKMPAVAFSFFSLTVILYCADTFYYSSRQIFYKWHKNASSVLATMEKGVGTIIC